MSQRPRQLRHRARFHLVESLHRHPLQLGEPRRPHRLVHSVGLGASKLCQFRIRGGDVDARRVARASPRRLDQLFHRLTRRYLFIQRHADRKRRSPRLVSKFFFSPSRARSRAVDSASTRPAAASSPRRTALSSSPIVVASRPRARSRAPRRTRRTPPARLGALARRPDVVAPESSFVRGVVALDTVVGSSSSFGSDIAPTRPTRRETRA